MHRIIGLQCGLIHSEGKLCWGMPVWASVLEQDGGVGGGRYLGNVLLVCSWPPSCWYGIEFNCGLFGWTIVQLWFKFAVWFKRGHDSWVQRYKWHNTIIDILLIWHWMAEGVEPQIPAFCFYLRDHIGQGYTTGFNKWAMDRFKQN